MRSTIGKGLALLMGLLLFEAALFSGNTHAVQAGALLSITGTPTEPVAPTLESTAAVPTATSVPVSTLEPTSKPVVVGGDKDHSDKPDPEIIKTVDQSAVAAGELLAFSLHVTNKGDKTASNVIVTDELPSYLDLYDFTSSKGATSASGRSLTVTIGDLAVGEQVLIRIRAYVNASAPAQGSNTGVVSNSNGDSDSSNNSSTTNFTMNPPLPSPTASPTAELPTATLPMATVMPAPTVAPVAPPVTLPVTGAGGDTDVATGALVAGMIGIALGLFVRRRSKR